jgi:hypothetical protein
MKDETWGALAWWLATLLKWVVLAFLVLLILFIVWSQLVGH